MHSARSTSEREGGRPTLEEKATKPPVLASGEPPLGEVIDEPIVRALMAIDGVSVPELRSLLDQTILRLRRER
jgi:hypothetical protein